MKKKHLLQNFVPKFEPIHWLLFVIAGLLILFFLFRYSYTSQGEINLVYENPVLKQEQENKNKKEGVRLGEYDPNIQLANRVLEANGITISLLQIALHQYFDEKNGVPSTGKELIEKLSKSDLKPPFILDTDANLGKFVSKNGSFWIKYSPKPLMIVVLSSGENNQSGAVFVLRTPDTSFRNFGNTNQTNVASSSTLYVARNQENLTLPQPFAVATQFIQSGFTVEPLNITDVSQDKLQYINRLLSEVK